MRREEHYVGRRVMEMKEEGREEGLTEDGWKKWRDCRRRKCTTVLHGGSCHRTSTPHKSGNKRKETKNCHTIINSCFLAVTNYKHPNCSYIAQLTTTDGNFVFFTSIWLFCRSFRLRILQHLLANPRTTDRTTPQEPTTYKVSKIHIKKN